MDMENTAHTPPAFTGITLEAILSTENLTSPLKTAQMCSNNIWAGTKVNSFVSALHQGRSATGPWAWERRRFRPRPPQAL